MTDAVETLLHELDARVQAAAAAGDAAAEAEARVRRAGILAELNRQAEAIVELEAVGPLFVKANRLAAHADAMWELALLLAREPKRRPEARKALLKMRALATLADRPDLAEKARSRHETLQAEADELEAAANLQATLLEQRRDAYTCIEAHRARADVHVSQGHPERADGELNAALTEVRELGDARLLLQVQLERCALHSFLYIESFARLFKDVVEIQRAVKALHSRRPARTEKAAELAREAALASGDSVLYTLSCLLIARARELRDDRPGVLAIMRSCKELLEQRFGKETARPAEWVLRGLEARWSTPAKDAELSEGMTLRLQGRVQDLEPHLRARLDPELPLDGELVAWTGAFDAGTWITWAAIAMTVGFVAAVIGVMPIVWLVNGKGTPVGYILAGLCWWILGALGLNAKRRVAARAQWRAGRWRHGLFLLDEGLLLRLGDQAITVPRAAVRRVRVQVSKSRPGRPRILYRKCVIDVAFYGKGVPVCIDEGLAETTDALAKRVEAWLHHPQCSSRPLPGAGGSSLTSPR